MGQGTEFAGTPCAGRPLPLILRSGNQRRRHLVEHQQEECQMTYLDLSPAIAALPARPEEFELSGDTRHHLGSQHRFRFPSEDSVEIHADCGCALMKASQEQTKLFHAAYRQWHASYWRPLESNREFASHF